ncbi:MAG: FtsX-like permease family protein [Ignavibacteria bacterium]|nr:FtsX-like permease family protein [Ignavibacteria bacterium]
MQIKESFKMALSSMRANKLRSSLTLVGIVIGLFSIIVVMTSIGAIQSSIETSLNLLGTNTFVVQKYPAIRMGMHSWRKYRNRQDITADQGLELQRRAKLPLAVGMLLERGGRTVKYKDNSTNPNVSVQGINTDAMQTLNIVIEFGRGLTNQDIEFSKDVCVIGNYLIEKLFPFSDPIGETIRVDGHNFLVVGVYEKRGGALGSGQDNFVSIPITVFQQIYGKDAGGAITVTAASRELYQHTLDEVEGILRTIRKVPPQKENDFEIISNESMLTQVNEITKYFKIGAAVVAFIALLAAGVGIMNIMLVSVTERTKEIGIRKSIGATRKNILSQFLMEAIVICQVGGIVGIVLGIIGGAVISSYLKISAILPVDWIVIGLVVCSFVGILFGVYPAYKAANLDPIEALRYE